MILLLTILSVLAVWAFLHVLMVGLLVIFKALDAVVIHLQQIAMGVRAIEKQTLPISRYRDPIVRALGHLAGAIGEASQRVDGTGEILTRAIPRLKS